MNKNDLGTLERYLRKVFDNQRITVKPRPRKTDSAEVLIGEESLGIISEIVDEGEKSYDFHMAILDIDLEE